MRTFTATVPVAPADFPAGTVEGPFRWMLNGPTPQTVDTLEPTVTFSVEPGDWTLQCQRYAADGATPLGPASGLAAFHIDAETVTISVVAGDISIAF